MERKSIYITRNGEIEHVWRFNTIVNGFETYLFIRGTYSEVRAYIESEYPHSMGRHHACDSEELEMIGELRMKIYDAPQIERRDK